jgi:hypothetical protein
MYYFSMKLVYIFLAQRLTNQIHVFKYGFLIYQNVLQESYHNF